MHRFAGLGERIAASREVGDAILDGEVIAADETGRPQFYDLLRDTRAPTYVAFDLLWLNDVDLRPLPLTAHCSLSAAGTFRASCPKGQRSFPKRCRSRAGGTGCSS